MRNASLALLIVTALAACGEAEPPKTAAAPQPLPPPKPLVQAPASAPAPAPVAAPQPSADELLAERVRQALRDTRKVDGQGVDVRAAGGAVTLYGTAPSARDRRKIEEFVAGIEGVQSVVSKLVVVRGS
jgi:hyperosmotically inducible periplasmic protein